jgi:PIN domain
MRLVIDTNLFVSAVFSGSGAPRQLFDAAKVGLFDLYTSEVLIAELLEVLTRDKHAKRMAKAEFTAAEFIDDLRRIAIVVATPLNPALCLLMLMMIMSFLLPSQPLPISSSRVIKTICSACGRLLAFQSSPLERLYKGYWRVLINP